MNEDSLRPAERGDPGGGPGSVSFPSKDHAPHEGHHLVQFYEDEAFLFEVVARFLSKGLEAGEGLVVIATGRHREGFTQRLAVMGFDVQAACEAGQLCLLDAQETLSQLMVDAMPDWSRCKDVLGGVLERSLEAGRVPRVRAYGEMVDLLWAEGNSRAALKLEELWEQLLQLYPCRLLCAYDMGRFREEAHVQPFREVCGAHSHVTPTERYTRIEEPAARLREVALLQQRAQVLENEIERRRQVEQDLLEALRLRDDFLSMAGHELKTPLTALQMQVQSAQSLLGEGAGERLRERLGKAERNIGRLAVLVEALLDVSRISAGRFELALEEVDLSALAREAVERAAESMARSACPTRVHAEEPVTGRWDRLRIEQVLTNLLSNAAKYGRGHPVEVWVSGGGERARLVVRDHGIGISPENQARIFDRFERAVSARHFGGLGLGLWITRQIVEAHGGTIHVESELGAGAAFVVELPRERVPRS